MEALRAAAAAAYYGDDGVMQRLGYDAGERVRRGEEIRAASPPEPTGGIIDLSGFTGTRTVVRADVAVIGSGAGGAVVAKELAEAGARVVLLEEGAQHERRGLHRPAARHAPAPVPRRRAARDARAAADPAPARPRASAAPRSSTPAPASARPITCSRAGATSTGCDMDLAPHFERVERELNVVARPARARRRERARRPPRRRGARLVGRLRAPQRARLRRLGRVRLRLPDERQAARRRHLRPQGPCRGRDHLHGRDRAEARPRRRVLDRRRRPPHRRRADASSSPPAPSTRPPCSPATASATTTSAATSRCIPPPPRGP